MNKLLLKVGITLNKCISQVVGEKKYIILLNLFSYLNNKIIVS